MNNRSAVTALVLALAAPGVALAMDAATATGKDVVQNVCAKCHASGETGAPRIGDRDAWIPRLRYGFDATVSSAIHGHGGMPARGGLPDLTDGEMRSAIVYMLNPDPPAPH